MDAFDTLFNSRRIFPDRRSLFAGVGMALSSAFLLDACSTGQDLGTYTTILPGGETNRSFVSVTDGSIDKVSIQVNYRVGVPINFKTLGVILTRAESYQTNPTELDPSADQKLSDAPIQVPLGDIRIVFNDSAGTAPIVRIDPSNLRKLHKEDATNDIGRDTAPDGKHIPILDQLINFNLDSLGLIASNLLIAKYPSEFVRAGLIAQERVPEFMRVQFMRWPMGFDISKYKLSTVMAADFTGVFAQEISELIKKRSWILQYVEPYYLTKVADNSELREIVTDQFSLPFQISVFEEVLKGSLAPLLRMERLFRYEDFLQQIMLPPSTITRAELITRLARNGIDKIWKDEGFSPD